MVRHPFTSKRRSRSPFWCWTMWREIFFFPATSLPLNYKRQCRESHRTDFCPEPKPVNFDFLKLQTSGTCSSSKRFCQLSLQYIKCTAQSPACCLQHLHCALKLAPQHFGGTTVHSSACRECSAQPHDLQVWNLQGTWSDAQVTNVVLPWSHLQALQRQTFPNFKESKYMLHRKPATHFVFVLLQQR